MTENIQNGWRANQLSTRFVSQQLNGAGRYGAVRGIRSKDLSLPRKGEERAALVAEDSPVALAQLLPDLPGDLAVHHHVPLGHKEVEKVEGLKPGGEIGLPVDQGLLREDRLFSVTPAGIAERKADQTEQNQRQAQSDAQLKRKVLYYDPSLVFLDGIVS